jgi:hypothetical protein
MSLVKQKPYPSDASIIIPFGIVLYSPRCGHCRNLFSVNILNVIGFSYVQVVATQTVAVESQ